MSIWDIGRRVLVDRAIGEVGKHILQAVRIVALRGKADDAFFEQVNFQRPHLRDQHVNPHVPLRTPDQQWIVNVLLNDTWLVVLQVVYVANQSNFTTPRQVVWFADPDLLPSILATNCLLAKCVHELFCLVGQTVSVGGKVVNFTEPAPIPL